MNIYNDERVVLTLDAGGTNFVFTAYQKGKSITSEVRMDSHGDDLEKCIATLRAGFRQVMGEIKEKPIAMEKKVKKAPMYLRKFFMPLP